MFKRSIIVATSFGGLLLLTAATLFPWTEVPMADAENPSAIAMIEPSITKYFKLGCQIIVMVGFLIINKRISRGNTVATLTACWLVMLLLYPYCVTVWHPRLSNQSAWLQSQYENLTGLSGDLGTGSEFVSAPLKGPIYPVDPPDQFAVFELPKSYPSELEMGGLADFCNWLGYTEAFCQFSRLGWFLALLGGLSILVSSCIAERPDQRRVAHVIRVVLFTGAAATAMAWTLPLCAGWHVRNAETSVRLGQYEAALNELNQAQRLLPILRHDTYMVAQRGCLYQQMGQFNRFEARLYRATVCEREGRLSEANAMYRALMHDAAPNSPCRREACRAILRDAIHALNSGSVEPAIAELHEVLAADPTNIKALYTLQLACVRSGKREELVGLVAQLDAICLRFQHPIKDTIRSAGQHNNFVSALDRDDLTSAIEAYQKAQTP